MLAHAIALAALAAVPPTARSASASGSEAPAEPPFASASEAIAAWLGDNRAAEWRAAVAAAPRASALGPALLGVASEELRVAEAMRSAALERLLGFDAPPAVESSLRLALAERCFFERRFDACVALLPPAAPERAPSYSPDLAAYLAAACAWMTVDHDAAGDALKLLPTNGDELAARLGAGRACVVERLRRELRRADDAPLTVVAGRMEDAERRLARGSADDKTQGQQRRAIERLDELIDDLEKQQQAAQQAAAGAGGGGATPAPDSRPSELKGPGEVDPRRFAGGDPWGRLSPAERERLTQGVARGFPGHYRELIENYFETLAEPPDAANADAEAAP